MTVGLGNLLGNFWLELPLLEGFCFTGATSVVLAGNICTEGERETCVEDWNSVTRMKNSAVVILSH